MPVTSHLTPSLGVRINQRLLDVVDGPMLEHELQDRHGMTIGVPRSHSAKPDLDRLEHRSARFLVASCSVLTVAGVWNQCRHGSVEAPTGHTHFVSASLPAGTTITTTTSSVLGDILGSCPHEARIVRQRRSSSLWGPLP